MFDLKSIIDVESILSYFQARKVLSQILNNTSNALFFTKHALREMENDDLKTGDILNVLKVGKIFNDPEFENGSYRYRVQTFKIVVVFSFRKPNQVIVITAWRKK